MTKTLSSAELRAGIALKRKELEEFISKASPRKRRLLNATIWGGTLAAALNAGPAIGGQSFTAWLTSTLSLTSPSWRVLCGAAFVCSVGATLATQLLKSDGLEERLTRALGCRARLEVLEAGLAIGHLSSEEATSQYLRCLEDVALLRAV